jgi:hypothetical protein
MDVPSPISTHSHVRIFIRNGRFRSGDRTAYSQSSKIIDLSAVSEVLAFAALAGGAAF